MLSEVPFAPLTQGYQTCTNDPTTSFLDSYGSTLGNLGAVTPLAVFLVMTLFGFYQKVTGKSVPTSFAQGDKDAALDALAVALLIARDRQARLQHEQRLKLKKRKNSTSTSNLLHTGDDGGGDGGDGGISDQESGIDTSHARRKRTCSSGGSQGSPRENKENELLEAIEEMGMLHQLAEALANVAPIAKREEFQRWEGSDDEDQNENEEGEERNNRNDGSFGSNNSNMNKFGNQNDGNSRSVSKERPSGGQSIELGNIFPVSRQGTTNNISPA
jgi:hypothetical protein